MSRDGRCRIVVGRRRVFVGRRVDSDFSACSSDDENQGSRRGSAGVVRLTPAASAHAVENLFDANTKEPLGFPALGRRATAGLRVATSR